MRNSITSSSITSETPVLDTTKSSPILSSYGESPTTFETPVLDATKSTPILSSYDESPTTFNSLTRYSDSWPEQLQIFKVAKWFLAKESMSHKKLQKMCYYAYAWFLVFFNDYESASTHLSTLCPAGFEAWVHGPVCSELYRYYKGFGWSDIPVSEESVVFPKDMTDLLEQVWHTYGSFSADQLEQLTHSEMPWIAARKGKKSDEPSTERIDDHLIFQYYLKMMDNE